MLAMVSSPQLVTMPLKLISGESGVPPDSQFLVTAKQGVRTITVISLKAVAVSMLVSVLLRTPVRVAEAVAKVTPGLTLIVQVTVPTSVGGNGNRKLPLVTSVVDVPDAVPFGPGQVKPTLASVTSHPPAVSFRTRTV